MYSDNPPPTLWLTEYNTPHDAYCHGIVEVLYQTTTPFQKLMIVRTGAYGKALVLDGCWQSSTTDEFLYHEPLVHPACVLHGGPQRVLILGGGEGAALREVLKWKTVKKAVLVDLDAAVLEACRSHLPEMHEGAFDDPRSEIIIGDAFDFFENDRRKWDVIISDLTDPLEGGPSYRLFTREYFQKCRDALYPGGCFVLQAGLAGPAEMEIHVRLARTVADAFDQMMHYISPVPTWASPMGFVLGTDLSVHWDDPEPGWTDTILSEKTSGYFRMFDGRSLRGLMNPPKYLRQAIAAEKRVYTLVNPPNDSL